VIGTEWSPDDDPADLVPRHRTVMMEASDLPDGLEVLREVSAGVRAAILAEVPEEARPLVAHLVGEGSPRAWAQAHGLSVPAAVAACRQAEAELPGAFQRAFAEMGPVPPADDHLVRAWIDVHVPRVSA
jgi:hypothetical protein